MNLITKSDILKSLPNRYKGQYMTNQQIFDGRWSDDIFSLLKSENPLTEDRANEILNPSWTSLKCDECGRQVQAVVQLGEEPDYESATAIICIPCLNEAIALTIKSNLP